MSTHENGPQTMVEVLAAQVHDLRRKRRNRGRYYRRRVRELERRVEILTEQCNLYQSLAISAAVENWNLKHGMD